jgi:serine/threonine protein kinase
MRSDLAQDNDLVTRFRDEAAMLASLHHVNLVQVYAFGEAEEVYFVMELVEGEPLSDVIMRLTDNDTYIGIDAGLAKRRDDVTDSAGTPGFAAPESFMDEVETTATDVYGLAGRRR